MDDTKKTGPRDVFSHLLAILFLYVSVFAFGAIVFSLIDLYFPDALQEYGAYARDGLRWPLAVLVVVFPCYLWLTWYLARDIEKHEEKKNLKTRKWLLYFTLFATTIAIVIDLVYLIFAYLNGELTVHFVLKVLTVLIIAAAVFTYYLWAIRRAIPAMKHPGMRVFLSGMVLVVVATTLFGFYAAGSPGAERMRRLDAQRTNDLQMLQYQIANYWQVKQKLPANLSELLDPVSGITVLPKDPVSGADYEYRTTWAQSFELCATFEADSSDSREESLAYPPYPGIRENGFEHGVGRTCFSRTIDPDRFPPINKGL